MLTLTLGRSTVPDTCSQWRS